MASGDGTVINGEGSRNAAGVEATPKKPRRTPGRMNKTEERFEREWIRPRYAIGEVENWGFERIKLRLGKATWYEVDFDIVTTEAILMVDVKGYWHEDARVKIKAAAQTFPFYLFVGATEPNGEGNGWELEYFSPWHGPRV